MMYERKSGYCEASLGNENEIYTRKYTMFFGRQSSEIKIKLTKGELNLCYQTEQKKPIVKCLFQS
ncbi:hypothetical protein C0J52_12944 [Blattella germanica]|nr:hypothetical protein C0J52_12944 [Blattella germanica]